MLYLLENELLVLQIAQGLNMKRKTNLSCPSASPLHLFLVRNGHPGDYDTKEDLKMYISTHQVGPPVKSNLVVQNDTSNRCQLQSLHILMLSADQ